MKIQLHQTTAHKYQPNCIYFLLWVCEGLSGTYRATHVSQGLLRSLHSVLLHTDGKSSHNVAAELHRDTAALQQMTGNHSARIYGTDATKPAEVCCCRNEYLTGEMNCLTEKMSKRLGHIKPNQRWYLGSQWHCKSIRAKSGGVNTWQSFP